jgi:polysaccharide pyruvyl transferase WcaK-like protein
MPKPLWKKRQSFPSLPLRTETATTMAANTHLYDVVPSAERAPSCVDSASGALSGESGATSSKMIADPMRKRIALFGMFGVGNLGNECTLQALLANLRSLRPDAQISCICGDPKETALICNLPALAIREIELSPLNNRIFRLTRKLFLGPFIELGRWVKVIKNLAGTHMLVMTGTGMLADVGISAFGLHYDILRWSIAAKLCRCKLVFVSVGAGPIRDPLSHFFVKAALRLADYRSYRDIFSERFVKKMGIAAAPGGVYPDLAFSLPAGALRATHACDGRKKVVGIGLITYDRSRTGEPEKVETIYRDYIGKLATFVRWLIEHNYLVRFIIGDVVYDNRVREDLRAFLEGTGLTYEAGQIIDEPAGSVQELLSQLAGTDIVVASRFHNVLLALMLGKPVLAISFHEKVDSLMTAMEMTQFCQDIENVDVNKLINQLAALEGSSENIRRGVEEMADSYRDRLEQQYEYIFKTLLAPS